jgi:hypothetical protein
MTACAARGVRAGAVSPCDPVDRLRAVTCGQAPTAEFVARLRTILVERATSGSAAVGIAVRAGVSRR